VCYKNPRPSAGDEVAIDFEAIVAIECSGCCSRDLALLAALLLTTLAGLLVLLSRLLLSTATLLAALTGLLVLLAGLLLPTAALLAALVLSTLIGVIHIVPFLPVVAP
jgi:hypothetical protein